MANHKTYVISWFLFVLITTLQISILTAQEVGPQFDLNSIRFLHHIPNSEYTANMSQDGRYLAALNVTYSGYGYQYSDIPNIITAPIYLELWVSDSVSNSVDGIITSPFERFVPPNRTLKIDDYQDRSIHITLQETITISPNNQWIAVGLWDEIRIYDLATLSLTTTIYQESWRFLEWSLDGTSLAYIVPVDDQLIVWNQDSAATSQTFELEDLVFSYLHAIPDGWVVGGYKRGTSVEKITACFLIRNDCQVVEIDHISGSNEKLPVLQEGRQLAVENLINPTNTMLGLDFSYLPPIVHSPNNQYLSAFLPPTRGVWDVVNQRFVQELSSNVSIAWLPSGDHFVTVDFPDPIMSLSLYQVGNQVPIQEFQFEQVAATDWNFLTQYLISATGPWANSADIFVDIDGEFIVINLTWVLVYIPVENN